MTDQKTDMTAADAEYVKRLVDALAPDIASLRKQLDEAREREAQMAAALREAREDILHAVNARGSEYEGTDEDAVGYIDAVLSAPASPSPVLRDADTAPAPAKAPEACRPQCEDETDCCRVPICRAVEEAYAPAPAPAINGGDSDQIDYLIEENERLASALNFVRTWIGRQPHSFSVMDLDALFAMSRARIDAALAAADRSAS